MSLATRLRPGSLPLASTCRAVRQSGSNQTLSDTPRMLCCPIEAIRGTGGWTGWRVFFGSLLIADGWRLVHASAVCIADRAVMIAAPPHGGKFTLAHRACPELGAALMADDLVFLGGAKDMPLAVGWPTRIAVPTECLRVDLVP